MKKIIGPFFSFYRVWQASKDSLKGSTSLSDNYCETYDSIFLGPERLLKTNISGRKAKIPLKKILRPSFLVVSNITIVMEQSYMGPEGSLIRVVQKLFDHFFRT